MAKMEITEGMRKEMEQLIPVADELKELIYEFLNRQDNDVRAVSCTVCELAQMMLIYDASQNKQEFEVMADSFIDGFRFICENFGRK